MFRPNPKATAALALASFVQAVSSQWVPPVDGSDSMSLSGSEAAIVGALELATLGGVLAIGGLCYLGKKLYDCCHHHCHHDLESQPINHTPTRSYN